MEFWIFQPAAHSHSNQKASYFQFSTSIMISNCKQLDSMWMIFGFSAASLLRTSGKELGADICPAPWPWLSLWALLLALCPGQSNGGFQVHPNPMGNAMNFNWYYGDWTLEIVNRFSHLPLKDSRFYMLSSYIVLDLVWSKWNCICVSSSRRSLQKSASSGIGASIEWGKEWYNELSPNTPFARSLLVDQNPSRPKPSTTIAGGRVCWLYRMLHRSLTRFQSTGHNHWSDGNKNEILSTIYDPTDWVVKSADACMCCPSPKPVVALLQTRQRG